MEAPALDKSVYQDAISPEMWPTGTIVRPFNFKNNNRPKNGMGFCFRLLSQSTSLNLNFTSIPALQSVFSTTNIDTLQIHLNNSIGIRSKGQSIYLSALDNNYDVIVLVETSLTISFKSEELFLEILTCLRLNGILVEWLNDEEFVSTCVSDTFNEILDNFGSFDFR